MSFCYKSDLRGIMGKVLKGRPVGPDPFFPLASHLLPLSFLLRLTFYRFGLTPDFLGRYEAR